MSAEAAGWDWFAIIGAAGSLAGIFAIFLHYVDKPDQVAQWVEKDPEYRVELAGKLRGARLGATYCDLLTRGLDWLDRNWGEAGSARALGICIIIGLCYAYAAFFLAWGAGGPGHIGGTRLPDSSIEGGIDLLGEGLQPGRALLALWLVAVLPLGFAIGRFFGHFERRLRPRLRRRHRWRRRRFELGYRTVLAFLFGISFVILRGNFMEIADILFLGIVYAVGPVAGIAAARRCQRDSLAGIVAALAGGAAFVAVFGNVSFIGISGTPSFEDGFTVALAVAFAGAVSLASPFAMAAALTGVAAVTPAGTFVGRAAAFPIGILAVAVAAAVGAATARRAYRGAFAGGIGCLVGYGVLAGTVPFRSLADGYVVVVIIFFLVLPVVNGFWDWLSWWITRALGRHLLTSFGAARGLWQRGFAVLGHGALDLVLAAALLAAMAFLLAFGFEAYNRIGVAQGTQVFDLGPFLARAADHPWSHGLWLTVMLISTLVPTAMHVVALLASPLALVTLPTEKRLNLAGELESYDASPERRASIQRRVGSYFTRERHLAVALAAGLFVILLAGLLALINLLLGKLDEGQTVAHLVLQVAEWGIAAARIFG